MKQKDSSVYVSDMLDAIERILEYAQGMDKKEFCANRQVLDAVVRNIEILGEAASKLPPEFRSKHDSVEWAKIIGTRNRLIHGYDDVNPSIVWDVVEYDLEPLKKNLLRLK